MKAVAIVASVAGLVLAAPAAAQNHAIFGNTSNGAGAATLTLDGLTPFVAVDTGWLEDDGTHLPANSNYATGTLGGHNYNSYFSFALGALSAASPYTTATLTIRNGDSAGSAPFVLSLFDISATVADLTQGRPAGDAAGQALFTDLGSGTSYGTYTFNGPTTFGTQVVIPLNAAFLGRVNSGLLTNFSIGGTLTPSAVSAAVPEPATWGLMILGFGAVGFAMRRRAKVRTNVRFA